jgi:pyruvate/2-oxoglutarate dehydrogenase complex dihydrolipoamide acyltransferase (E2) component
LVQKLAAEHGVDLTKVGGTGVGGRIRKQDVLEAAQALQQQQPRTARPTSAPPAAGGTAPAVITPGLSWPQHPAQLSYSAPTIDGGAQAERHAETTGNGKYGKVGRNEPCPCGSGRKYKLCHGDPRNRLDT